MRLRAREPVVAALISVLLWSSAFVAIRFVGRQLGPGPLALARLGVGSLALSLAMLVRRERLPRGRAAGFAVLSGLLWFGIYNLALNAAERRIDAGTSALLVNTGPLFLAFLAGALLHEGFPRALITGCMVSFAGVVLIAVGVSHSGLRATWGAALCLLAAVVYAGGVVAQRPALRDASALSVTWLACTVAALACLPYAPELIGQLGRARASTIGWTVYLGIGPLAIGFATWAFAPGSNPCRPAGRGHVPRAAAGRGDQLGGPGRDAAAARTSRRDPVPGRRRPEPTPNHGTPHRATGDHAEPFGGHGSIAIRWNLSP